MADLPLVSAPGKASLDLTAQLQAASAADTFSNDGRTLLYIKTGATATGNATAVSTPCSHGRAGEDVVQALSASKEYLLGPFPPGQYNDANGKVAVNLSAPTDVEAAALKL